MINTALLFLPPSILKYVITHELAHTVQRNHSRAYWREVEWAMPTYEKARDKKQLERFVITNKRSGDDKKQTEGPEGSRRIKMEKAVKIIPPDYDLFEYNVTQLIYGNKIAFVDYNTETAVIIENPVIAKFQQKIFKLLFAKL